MYTISSLQQPAWNNIQQQATHIDKHSIDVVVVPVVRVGCDQVGEVPVGGQYIHEAVAGPVAR